MNSIDERMILIELVALQTAIHNIIKKIFREEQLNLNMDQLPVIMCIHSHGVLCQQEIADLVIRDKSSIQRTVCKLEERGLLTTRQPSDDKRKKLLSLTEKGKLVANKIVGFKSATYGKYTSESLIYSAKANLKLFTKTMSAL